MEIKKGIVTDSEMERVMERLKQKVIEKKMEIMIPINLVKY